MHLQSLELLGFKSFADKTVFNFHEGVTAIVGPNGCGKSNLLDAIRWVLGEQSAKSLRGGEMADVIFNGTDSRKPLGFAEVSLMFTDCATELGVDWHDVRVTRRVYRDGNSEYFINKTPCRLRDIQSLFADTGVARAAYSMMEQGKIDMILSSRPEDRRAVFEEAAGITKYKSQKREALRKLEATEANLLRIGDVIKEVKRQIGSLQRQAGKARRYQSLHADLRVLDTHHSWKQLDVLERNLAACRTEITKFSDSEQTTRAGIDVGESGIAEERLALDKIDVQVAEARAEVQLIRTEIATHRSRIEFNRQRAQELKELIERAKTEIAAAEAKRNEQATQIREADVSLEESKHLLQERESELTKLTEALSHARSQRAKFATEAQELQIALTKAQSQISALEDELSGTVARREATAAQIRRLETEIKETTGTLQKMSDEIAAARAAAGAGEKQLADLLAETHRAGENLHRQQETLAQAETDLTAFERSLAEKKSRLEVLRQLNQEGRGLAEGSQAVLSAMNDRFREAIVGPLVSQLDVDPKFIAAVEAALGRNLNAVVLKNADAANDIIARLTRKKLGKAALLIPQLATSVPQSVRKVLPGGAIAWAMDKVFAPRQLEPLIRQLLGNVVIFSKLEQALECKKNDPTLAMATLSGEFVSTEGIVFGGSTIVKSDSLLERKAEIANLEKEEASLIEQRDKLSAKREEAKAALALASQKLNQSRERHQAAHLSHSTSSGQISLREREREELARKMDSLRSEKTTLQQQISAADEAITDLEQELESARSQTVARETEQTAADAAARKATADEAGATEKLTELRLTIATEKQRHENLQARRQPMAERETELAQLIAARRADIAMHESKLASQAQESRDSETAIKTQTANCEGREGSVAKIAEQRAARLAAIAEREKEVRALRDSLSELQDRRGHAQVRESQLQMQIENLAENISRRYQIDLRAFSPDQTAFEKTLRVQLKRRIDRSAGDVTDGGEAASNLTSRSESTIHPADVADEDLRKLIADLTRQLDNMGPVNLDAVQEYDELEDRYKFLENQNTDLTNSRRELLDVISQINSTTKKLFAETFAQVRANFREMFAELFGGGRADLSLMDESDPLNCGIEIAAKPPGKQLQSVSLLSGGERAMTAVALLFAIYMVRPSPFCVLDEMDAPLDESNINRFIQVLDRFIGQSQFIIITHNKRTIAKAGVLYGVTMEERGISKLVGMKLTAPAEAAAQQPTNGNGHQEAATQRNFTLVAR
jgi:chromosome segregation protein